MNLLSLSLLYGGIFLMSYKVESLTIGYGNKRVVEDINIDFNDCGIYQLNGENGAGKTTLLLTLTGHLKPISGSFDTRLKDGLFFVQDSDLYDNLSGFENIRLITKKNFSEEEMINEAKKFGIADILSRKAKNYSYGERMRLLFTASTFSDNKIIYFDEIDKGIDKGNLKKLVESVEVLSKDKLIIITSHRENNFYSDISTRIVFKDKKIQIINEDKTANNLNEKIDDNKDTTPAKENKPLLRRALFSPILTSIISCVFVLLSALMGYLFSGSNYKIININDEVGYNIVLLENKSDYFSLTPIIDDDVKHIPNAVPDYLSFSLTDKGMPSFYISNNDEVDYAFIADYVDLDLVDKQIIDTSKDDGFTLYFNSSLTESFKENYNIDINKSNAKCKFKFEKNDKDLGPLNFNFDVKMKKLNYDDSPLGLNKVYYSGSSFKKAMSNYKVTVEENEIEFLDYIKTNRINNGYKAYNFVGSEELLNDIALKDEEDKNYTDYDGNIYYSASFYTAFHKKIKANQLDPTLFFIFGLISTGITSLFAVFAALITRKNRSKSFLLSLVFKYKNRDLIFYIINYLIPCFAGIISSIVITILAGINGLFCFIPPLLFLLLSLIFMIVDDKHPYNSLIKQRKTSGVD